LRSPEKGYAKELRVMFEDMMTNMKKTGAESVKAMMAEVVCYNCGEKGHFRKDCTRPKQEKAEQSFATGPGFQTNPYFYNGQGYPRPGFQGNFTAPSPQNSQAVRPKLTPERRSNQPNFNLEGQRLDLILSQLSEVVAKLDGVDGKIDEVESKVVILKQSVEVVEKKSWMAEVEMKKLKNEIRQSKEPRKLSTNSISVAPSNGAAEYEPSSN
jgi:hypothetical protein